MQTLQILFVLLFKPLTNRIKIGEGGIVLFNTLNIWFATKDTILTAAGTAIGVLALCAVYGFNDYIDRVRDAQNPKKEQDFVKLTNDYAGLFLAIIILLNIATALAAKYILGVEYAVAFIVLVAVNSTYSLFLKSVPFADIFVVIAWGGSFILMAPLQNYYAAAIAGVMTGIAHIYQMMTDAHTDRATKVNTTIAVYPKSEVLVILLLVATLGVLLYTISNSLLMALSVLLLLLSYFALRQIFVAWFVARAYFAIIWVLLLYSIYGGI